MERDACHPLQINQTDQEQNNKKNINRPKSINHDEFLLREQPAANGTRYGSRESDYFA